MVAVWAERISWVELTHFALRSDSQSQQQLALWMADQFPDTCTGRELGTLQYIELVKTVRSVFCSLPRKTLGHSLDAFMERMVNYLTPGIVLGVPPEVRQRAASFVEAISTGRMSSMEARMTVT